MRCVANCVALCAAFMQKLRIIRKVVRSVISSLRYTLKGSSNFMTCHIYPVRLASLFVLSYGNSTGHQFGSPAKKAKLVVMRHR